MGKKYIIEIEEEPLVRKSALHGETAVWRASGFNSLVFDNNGLCKQHEVELHAIAYTNGKQDGYQKGLNDAWDAARKICDMKWTKRNEVFGIDVYADIIALPVSECIEKIRQYEQEKEEIKVGDEVKSIERGWTAVVVRISNDDSLILMDSNGAIADAYNKTMFVKTGRHFSEIAEVLTKMRGK